jgi:hypothetical protein
VIDLMQRMEFFAMMLKVNTFSGSALAVAFLLLYRHLNGRTGRCNPSIPVLANETGLTSRGVQKAVAELRNSGWWQVTQGVGRGHTNSYAPCLKKANAGSLISSGKGEPQLTLSVPENTNNKVKKHEPQFARTSKNQESDSHTVNAHACGPTTHAARSRARIPWVEGQGAASGEFDIFWQIYPHRGSFSDPKQPAWLKFEAAIKRGVDPAVIIAGAKRYRAHVEQEGTEPRFRPQAKTWLNEERWAQLHKPEPPRLRVGMN